MIRPRLLRSAKPSDGEDGTAAGQVVEHSDQHSSTLGWRLADLCPGPHLIVPSPGYSLPSKIQLQKTSQHVPV